MKTRLKELRLGLRLSQIQLSNQTHISQSVISKIENDFLCPNSQIIAKLSHFFKVSTDYFLCMTDEKCSPKVKASLSQKVHQYHDLLHMYSALSETDQDTAFNLIKERYSRIS